LRRRRARKTGRLGRRGETARPAEAEDAAPSLSSSLSCLVKTGSAVTEMPLVGGNRLEPLANGDETYQAMLAAIDGAERTVALASYIFCRDDIGAAFVEALKRAQARGVAVRVLVDGVGIYYSYPTILTSLAAADIPAAAFLPTWVPGRWLQVNLRNHRKILVVDGTQGFTGGVNIQGCNLAEAGPRHRVVDMHFRIQGPVVAQISETFIEDWAFATGEILPAEEWLLTPPASGQAWARGIVQGPDVAEGPLAPIILTAVNQAQKSIRIVSPYFLPEPPLINALRLAAKRGVSVSIVTPQRPGFNPVEWAAQAQFDLLLEAGCRLYGSGPVFDHAKLATIDGAWSLIGSSNWDPRSFRLNFEFNVEVYDEEFAARIESIIDTRATQATPITMADLRARGRWRLLRNRFLWLFQPYL
jgi:cardiolipin synthase